MYKHSSPRSWFLPPTAGSDQYPSKHISEQRNSAPTLMCFACVQQLPGHGLSLLKVVPGMEERFFFPSFFQSIFDVVSWGNQSSKLTKCYIKEEQGTLFMEVLLLFSHFFFCLCILLNVSSCWRKSSGKPPQTQFLCYNHIF